MAKIDQLFQKMVELGASDLHLTTGAKPLLRLHGKMTPLGDSILTPQETQSLLFEILTEKQKKEFVRDWELDCAYSLEGVGRFRVNIFMQRKGLGAVFRTIPVEILSAEKLGLPPQILNLTKEHKGLIVVTGPTGSGKSTTLAAMIDYINKNESAHILTVEDPVEFVHENQKSLVNQREVGSHTKSFANALKAALREDPDIILVGEMRDLETISLAMTAAETGHLVFGTLHTNNAAKTVDRIIDVFPQEQQAQIRVMLSESLKAVVAQGLLPTADGKGRCAAIEILVNTHAVGNLIREGKTFQIPSIMQTSSGKGMITFENNIRDLVRSGKITLETGNAFLGKKEEAPEAPSRPDPLSKPTISADDKKMGLSSIANRLKKNG
ncbi:MAG: type IV pilus twitching motility protein PilT [Bdellovibrionota bacterium]|nr:type IV pilus twitching motility protein PilT [Bdellovibrionota bacterium]